MARQLRLEFENAVYHVTARGNNRKDIFKNESDYLVLLSVMKEAKEKYGFIVYAYSLMPNHYHLLIKTPDANLSRIMKYIQTKYSMYFNRSHNRVGHLFQGRYKAMLVDEDNYLLSVIRYIHLNPVRAHLSEKIEEYKWTSFCEYMGYDAIKIIFADPVLKYVGINDTIRSRKEFYKFCYEGVGVKWDDFSDDIEGGLLLGDSGFRNNMKSMMGEINKSEEIACHNRLIKTGDISELADKISMFIEKNGLFKKKKDIRKIIIYFLKKKTDVELKSIAEHFGGIHYSSVSKTVSRLEKERSMDTELDFKLRKVDDYLEMSNVKIRPR